MSFPRYRFVRGFTLVELLVVVVIVGLLASLSISVIGRAMGTAKTAQCASNMCQVVQGLLQWSANNDTYLPCYVTSVSGSAGYYWYGEVSRNANTAWGTTLPYCAHNPLLKWETTSTVWICPANNPFQSKPATTKDCSYGINGKAVPNAPNSTPVKMVNVTKPSQCVAITEWHSKS